MSSVGLSQLGQYFPKYDIDKNGKLDRPEVAQAALNLLGSDNPQDQTAGSLFSTFVQGGKDGQGLFPDFNQDGGLSLNELSTLAGASGNSNALESGDFQASFGNRFQPGGGTGNIDGLKQIAEGNLNKFNAQQNPQGFANSTDSLAGGQGQVAQLLLSIVQLLLPFISGGQNSGGSPA